MVRVRRRRRRRRGTLILLLHAPSPLLRGGNPLHQHRIFLLPSLLLLLMLFLLVEASHARPTPSVPRPAPRQPPVPRPPQWTVVMGRPTEGFDPGEERENEVIGTDLPWERTQPSASSELHHEGPRGEAAAGGVSGDASNSVIEDGNDTLPVPLYGIMTDEISSDVDLMLGEDGGGDGVTSEELVMWRLTNHDRRKGELETDEELLSRNRRTPREKKGGRKEAGKKKKKEEEEEKKGKGRQRRRKGMRRPRWRERSRKAKEARENRERGGRGRDRGRNKKGKDSNPRPQRRRHQGHQFSTRERFLEITESVAAKKARRPRGGAVPKKPPVSRPRAKTPRIRGPGSMPRDVISSGEGGVSSGNLEDGAARSERSANLSHITGTARKIQMVVKNRNLQIDPLGRVSGAEDEDSDYTILQRTSVSTGRLKIQGVATCLFLCMDRCGLLYGSKNFTEECVWNETMDGHVYNVYTSVAYSNEDRALYLALNGAGKPRRVQIQRKDGKGLVLGKLSTYARVLTRTIQPNRLQRLEDKLLRDRQLEAVAQAVIAAGGTIPGYSNLTAGSLRHRIGPQQPIQIAKTNAGVNPSANRSSDLTSILTSLGLDPSIINPDFNLDSVTFADHPLRHHGYHQLCPMPRSDMVTSGSELVGKNGKVLCKKKDPPIGKGKSGKGPGGGGSGEKKKKKKDEDKDGKMRRKRKNQAKDVEEKKRKNNGGRNNGGRNNGGRNNGKRGGGGGGGGGRGGGTKVKKVAEKRVSKGKGNKEKGGERKAEMNMSKNEGRRGRNGEVQKKKKSQAQKERERKNGQQEKRRRVRKRPCNVGRRPRKDKECDKEQRKRKRHRRGKDEMHQEQVLHNNTLEEKKKVVEEEEVTESPLEWEEEEVGEEERGSEEEDVGEEESTEGNEDEDGEDGDEDEEEEDDEEGEEGQEEDDGEEEEGDEDEEEEDDDDDEDDNEEEFEEEEDGGENDGRGINVRRKRTRERDKREEDSESS